MKYKILVPRYAFKSLFLRYLSGIFICNNHSLKFDNSIFLNSASSCIAFYLDTISLKRKFRVGVPIFICSSVLEAIKSSGHEIVFLDIAVSNQGYIFDENILNDLDVIVFVHFFGYKFHNINGIKRRFPKMYVIEDCSHLLYNFGDVNIQGDAGMFSFNFHKPMPVGTGGVLVIPERNAFLNFFDFYGYIKPYGFIKSFRKFIYIAGKDIIFLPFIYNLAKDFVGRKRAIKQSHYIPQKLQISKPPKFFWRFINFYARLGMPKKTECKSYLKILKEFRLNCNASEAEGLLYFPVFCKDQQQKKYLIRELKLIGIEAFQLWENFIKNAYKFSCSIDLHEYQSAEIFSEKIFFLPQDLFLSYKNYSLLQRAIDIINQTENLHHD